ncbi:ATP-binding cassette domain-containing protein [Geobacter sulfurreducens subsp. ethanolicus]|uniref:ATP-binding cassette domain-containing protein n=1 Tax=Geobacter sulfurreducens TaxID=35554 RepID=UPI0025741BFC|nr:ATP-binding cassette domain-containing protein [Geobacter sulfurreducens]BEH11082.1 ATP-binding cassette domain-containing protein [Geobacter sulfurreducens subsp. ethanolicus]
MALITLRNITLAFGGPPLFDGINLQIGEGERLCLMGRNGTGKSTLLKLIAGEIPPEGGEIMRQQGVRVALVSQEVPRDLEGTVFDVVAQGMGEATALLAEYHRVSHLLAVEGGEGLLAQLATLQKRLEETGGWHLHQEVERVLNRLSLDADAPFSSLSGGTKRRALLARALVAAPDILILDEPTNHLDIDTILWLEEFLAKNVTTLLFVTHDRAFARRLANRVAELDRGRIYAFACGYDEFVERREALLEAEITRQALFDKKLAQEEAWIRQGIKARRTRNEGRVRALKKLREERRQRRERQGTATIRLQEAERSGALVVEAENASVGYGDRAVIANLTTTVMRGDRVGIIGPNGSGKTTLLRLLLGELEPQQGAVRLGTRRGVLYFDQMREQLDLDRTVQENVGEGNDTVIINGRSRHVIGYLQDFLFPPERARTPVSILSGGERNRLLLAKLFTKPSNVLVMDEPTNDLDAETLDLLEDLLLEYSGTLLLVSHDREFLNNVVTSTLVLSGDGQVREYVGGYDDWLRQAAAETPAAKQQPAKASADTSAKTRERNEKPRKLSFKEERELEALPEWIHQLEEEQERLHATLADPEFYRGAGAEVAALNTRLAELEGELETAYARWEELESLRG